MKKINYSERSSFYYQETYSEIDHDFLKKVIQIYSINSVLDIPCAAGRNLGLLAKNCKNAIFCDIEKNMIDQVKDRICTNNFENCKCICEDIKNYSLEEKVDMTIVMRQAIQLFSPNVIGKIIENILVNTSKIVVLDLYNFEKKGVKGQIPEYLNKKFRVFKVNENRIIRLTSTRKIDEGILVKYYYYMKRKNWSTQYKLYNLNIEYIKKILLENNVKRIIEYSDYFFNSRNKTS